MFSRPTLFKHIRFYLQWGNSTRKSHIKVPLTRNQQMVLGLHYLGVIYKPCGHGRGEGVSKMSILRYYIISKMIQVTREHKKYIRVSLNSVI